MLKKKKRRKWKMSEWISVKDKLPELDTDVLLYWDESYPCDIGSMYKQRYFQRGNDNMGGYDVQPNFWQPLPEPPKS